MTLTKFEQRIVNTWPDKADRVLAIIRGTREHVLATSAAARLRDRQSYHPHETATLKLEALNELLDGCGVEGIPEGHDDDSPGLSFVNMGDTYDTTIVFVEDRRVWRVTSWGDIVERGSYD